MLCPQLCMGISPWPIPTCGATERGKPDVLFEWTNIYTRSLLAHCQVGRCSRTRSKPVLKVPMVSAIETILS